MAVLSVILTLKSMDEILWFNHANETPFVELLPSAT